jgi:pimeloyl-ACP methyl ester carboxylesterase
MFDRTAVKFMESITMSHDEEPLDHASVSDRLFYPRPGTVVPNFVVTSEGCELGCFRREFDPDWPWIIYFHGNAELAEECDEFIAELFESAGANVCFAEYRGFGFSGDQSRLGTMLGDGRNIFDALQILPKRTIAFGRSIGSLFAIELASRVPDLGGLVIESGIAVPHEHWPVDEIAAFGRMSLAKLTKRFEEKLDHKAKLGNYSGPLLVMHTVNDGLVPPSNAERMHAWASGADKRLILFEWGHHNSILQVNTKEYRNALEEFVEQVIANDIDDIG